MTTYQIIDARTGLTIGRPYKSRSRAYRRADKLDLAYGGYRYTVRIIWGEE